MTSPTDDVIAVDLLQAVAIAFGQEGEDGANAILDVLEQYPELITVDSGFAALEQRIDDLEGEIIVGIDPDVEVRLIAAAAALTGDTVTEPPPPGGESTYLKPTGGDDTQMVLDKVAELEAAGRWSVLRMEGQFHMTEPLVIQNIHVDADTAELVSTADVAIQIGAPGQVISRKRLALPWVIGDASGSAGVKILAAKACTFTVDVYRYDRALWLAAEGEGVAWNTFNLRSIRGRQPLALDPAAGGWCNQNTFIGGQLFPEIDQGGPSILLEGYSNGNAFYNPSPEGHNQDWMIDCNGPWNKFDLSRFEGVPAKVRFRGFAEGNIIAGGYDLQNLVIDESELPAALQGTNLVINPYV